MVKSIHKAEESLGIRKTKKWKFSLQFEKEDDVKKKITVTCACTSQPSSPFVTSQNIKTKEAVQTNGDNLIQQNKCYTKLRAQH